MFSGIGGFRLGLEMAGHECVGHCEIDKYANNSYLKIHNVKENEWYGNDITKVRADELPNADVWCFGFPCQDISIAGKHKGIREGTRSGLFYSVTSILRQIDEDNRPSILFIENVKNLLSINGGWDFAKVLVELDEVGYDAEWQVLNSKDLGVPQNRDRIFLIGHLRGRSGREIFPITKRSGQTIVQIGNLNESKGWDNPQTGRIYSINGISPTINTCGGGQREPKILIDKHRIRKLTPKECWRLQGFSDEYFDKAEQVNSNSQLYKQAGNSVTVSVIHEIASRFVT